MRGVVGRIAAPAGCQYVWASIDLGSTTLVQRGT
jgi:hypothetical protein